MIHLQSQMTAQIEADSRYQANDASLSNIFIIDFLSETGFKAEIKRTGGTHLKKFVDKVTIKALSKIVTGADAEICDVEKFPRGFNVIVRSHLLLQWISFPVVSPGRLDCQR